MRSSSFGSEEIVGETFGTINTRRHSKEPHIEMPKRPLISVNILVYEGPIGLLKGQRVTAIRTCIALVECEHVARTARNHIQTLMRQ